MDMRTGEIFPLEELEKRRMELLAAGMTEIKVNEVLREIPQALMPQIPEVQNMNRKDKRAWLRKNKHLFNR